jgi:hypothetical protein
MNDECSFHPVVALAVLFPLFLNSHSIPAVRAGIATVRDVPFFGSSSFPR